MKISQIIYEPLGVWPKPVTNPRKRSPFKYRWNEVLLDLRRELTHLGAEGVVIHVDVPDHMIRRSDGGMRADARPKSPAVKIVFTATKLPGEPVQVYPCDTFKDWQSNVVAITRSLEKLRAVDRYGVTTAGEQYAGFKALPASTSATMSTEAAALILSEFSDYTVGQVLSGAAYARQARRVAQARTHPDRVGNSEQWDQVERAVTVLTSHFGQTL